MTAINTGNIVLRGVPRQMQDRISQVLLEITPDHRIARMSIDEVDGSVTEFQFRDQRENVNVKEQRFRLLTPTRSRGRTRRGFRGSSLMLRMGLQ